MTRNALAAAAFATLAAATAAAATNAGAEAPVVVTDIAPVHSLVAQVMDGVGTPMLLTDRGADPHAFQLRPSQAVALSGADLVFWIGPELTPWLDRALKGSGAEAAAVPLLRADGVRLRHYGEAVADDHAGDEQGHDDHAAGQDGHDDHADDQAAGQDGHDDHADDQAAGQDGHDDAAHDHAKDHAGADPHAWLDPANARAWVALIAQRLAAADPANAATYAANAAAADAALVALDAEIRATLSPAAGRPIFVFHDAYGYLTAAYGLTVAGTIADGDAAAPGAQRIARIRAALIAAPGACLFAEADHDPAYVETLVEATGVQSGVLDPIGATLEPGPELYGRLMRALAAGIAGCTAAG